MSARRPLVGGHVEEGQVHTRPQVSRMLLIAGCAFAFVGLVDLILLWFPMRAGNVAWEYATVGRTLDALPMPTLGVLLIGYGVLRSPRPTVRHLRLVSGCFAALGLLTIVLAGLVFTAAPAVLAQTPPEAAATVRRAATRHGVQAVVYTLAWLAIALVIWRAGKSGEET